MSLLKNINRLSWRFGSLKTFTPDKKDVEALNSVITWINEEKAKRVNENRYFGKAIVFIYLQLMRRYNNDNQLVEKEIQDILSKPLEYWYQWFTMQMNLKSWNDATDVMGIEDTFYEDVMKGELSIDKVQDQYQKKKEILASKENQDLLIQSLNPWSQEQINNKLNFFISEILNKYGNKP